MKKIFLTLLFINSFSSEASSFDLFYQGLQKAFYLKRIDRGLQTSEHVRLKKFGRLGRIFSPDASATYNDKTNTISLDGSLLFLKNGRYQAYDAQLILTSSYSGFSTVATIFHELGHAEMDIFIKKESSLKYFYKTKLKRLYRTYFPGINPWTVFHEHFAYYRTDLIETMSLDMMDLHMENGWHPQKETCYLTPHLRKLKADGVGLEEFTKIQTTRMRNYQSVTPSYIFVRGKDLDLSKVKGADAQTLKEAHALFWHYHQEFFGFQKNISDMALKMNADSRYQKLKDCRASLY